MFRRKSRLVKHIVNPIRNKDFPNMYTSDTTLDLSHNLGQTKLTNSCTLIIVHYILLDDYLGFTSYSPRAAYSIYLISWWMQLLGDGTSGAMGWYGTSIWVSLFSQMMLMEGRERLGWLAGSSTLIDASDFQQSGKIHYLGV